MVYLGRIVGVAPYADGEPVPLPYYAVAKLSSNGDGTIEGIFAMPVDRPVDLDMIEGITLTRHLERGIYYLGWDFNDMRKRGRWTLCRPVTGNLEIYSGKIPKDIDDGPTPAETSP
jgi:hypothetical protein